MTMPDQPFTWTGDLDDDCTCEWRGYVLRAEQMDDNAWWFCVYWPGSYLRRLCPTDTVGGLSTTGPHARWCCEQAAEAHYYKGRCDE